MTRAYRVKPRAGFVDTYADLAHIPDLTVYELEPSWTDSGLLDANGNTLYARTEPKPLGFIDFSRRPKPRIRVKARSVPE